MGNETQLATDYTPKPLKWRKKPVMIDALLFNGDNTADALAWINNAATDDSSPVAFVLAPEDWDYDNGAWFANETFISPPADGGWNLKTTYIAIETLEGPHTVRPGDFIIRGVAGEFYPCKPDIFAQSYEPVNQHD